MTVLTTPTIMNSFLRKYSAITGISVEVLQVHTATSGVLNGVVVVVDNHIVLVPVAPSVSIRSYRRADEHPRCPGAFPLFPTLDPLHWFHMPFRRPKSSVFQRHHERSRQDSGRFHSCTSEYIPLVETGMQAMYEEGILSAGRRDFLLNFPWHHSVILHEAGVPPIHTPMKTLEDLSEDIKSRLYLVHCACSKLPVVGETAASKPPLRENTNIVFRGKAFV